MISRDKACQVVLRREGEEVGKVFEMGVPAIRVMLGCEEGCSLADPFAGFCTLSCGDVTVYVERACVLTGFWATERRHGVGEVRRKLLDRGLSLLVS